MFRRKSIAKLDGQALALLCWLIFFLVLPAAVFASEMRPLSAYWITVLFGMAVMGTLAKGEKLLATSALVLLFLIFGAASGFYFYRISAIPVGMDEDMLTGRTLRIPDLIWVAGGAQQPPLFTFLFWDALHWLGRSLPAARAISAVFAALAPPLLWLLLLRTGASRRLALAGSVFLLLDPLVTSLAREVRPYSCGTFFFLVYLLVLSEPGGQKPWRRFFRLVIAGFLFLVSLGAQPLFLGFSAALAHTLVHRGEKHAVLPLAAFAAALALFLPFQWEMAGTYPQHLSASFPVSAAWGGLAEISQRLAASLGLLSLSLLLIPLALVWCREKSDGQRNALALLLLPLLALPLYAVFFGALIPRMHHDRYLLLLKAAALIGALAAASLLARKGRRGQALLVLLLLPGSIALFRDARVPVTGGDPKWKLFFTYLDSKPQPESLALMFSVASPEVLEFSGFVGKDFYFSAEAAKKVLLESAWDEIGRRSQASAILAALRSGARPEELLLYDVNLRGSRRLDQYRLSNVAGVTELDPGNPEPPLVLRIRNVGGLEATLDRLLTELEAQEKSELLKFRIYLGLAAVRVHQRRCEEAWQYWRRVQAIPNRPERLHDSLDRERKMIEGCGKS